MADRDEFVGFVIDQLRPWGAVVARRLFGGQALYRGTTVFALLIRDTLYFRTDAVNQPDYEAAGMAPFSYMRGDRRAVALGYHQVPADIIEDAEAFAVWADKAFAAALRKSVKRTGHGKRGTGRAPSRRKPAK